MDAIQTENLTKYYGKSRGIEDVCLRVEEGDFFGFIGPNGAGKSTTIRLLLGLILPTGGSAEIFGRRIADNSAEVLADIGYLPAEAAFYSGMRVGELLEFFAKLRQRDCAQEAKRLCERLELDTSRKIQELSLGNRKKVGIVCALQHRPRLCILDEPTSGLDPLMQRSFYSILRERNAEGMTVFLSTHVLSEVGRYCGKAAVIREGRILAADTVANLGHTGTKRVTLRSAQGLPDLENVRDLRREGDAIRFLYSGTPDALVQALSGMTLSDIAISDPELDEVFAHYYAKEAGIHDTVLA